MTAKYY